MLTLELLSGAGGVGKSTLSLCLAAHWSKEGASVAIYDGDESKQLTDAIRAQEKPNDYFTLVNHVPTDGFDILIIDNSPSTRNSLHKHDIIVYPMLAHGKSIRALERTKRLIKTDKIAFVATRCNNRSSTDKANAAIIKNQYNGSQMSELSFYKRVLEEGGNFLDFKGGKKAMVKAEISRIAAQIEKFI